MELKKISVIGAGTMGSGIAQVSAQSGLNVSIYDQDEKCIDEAIKKIERNLQRLVEKDKRKNIEKSNTLKRIKKTNSFENCLHNTNIVIEAIIEDCLAKKSLFNKLDKRCKPDVILATNTSSISITEIASVTSRPERVVGIHFFNPVQMMDLVEIVSGKFTSEKIFLKSKEFIEKINKMPVNVKDYPGFIVNRLLIPMINEGINLLEEGIADKENIDKAMRMGCNHPIGPLALADLIGLDICLNVMKTLYNEFSDPKYRPSQLLIRMVRAGLLGRKSKKGFYDYDLKEEIL